MDSTFALGVDIGGSHITAAMVNLATGQPLAGSQVRMDMKAGMESAEIIAGWASVIQRCWLQSGVKHSVVGIAMPGPFDYENGICLIIEQDKFKALYGMSVRNLLAAELGLAPSAIRFINDASSFLKGEMVAGSMRNQEQAVGITLGTGLGSAFSNNNIVVDADLWSMPFQSGIAEDYLSTRWFVASYETTFQKQIRGVKELTEPTMERSEAMALFNPFAANLAQFIAQVTTKLNCYHVVIGGNIARASHLFLDRTRSLLALGNNTAVLSIAELGEMAPIIGAASLFEKENVEKV